MLRGIWKKIEQYDGKRKAESEACHQHPQSGILCLEKPVRSGCFRNGKDHRFCKIQTRHIISPDVVWLGLPIPILVVLSSSHCTSIANAGHIDTVIRIQTHIFKQTQAVMFMNLDDLLLNRNGRHYFPHEEHLRFPKLLFLRETKLPCSKNVPARAFLFGSVRICTSATTDSPDYWRTPQR
jgi:hypothetical protein